MRRSQADLVRDWLKAYMRNEQIIDEELEKLRTLRARMMSVGAQRLSDMPKAPSSNMDKMAEMVIRADELENSIRERIKIQDIDRNAIESLANQLGDNQKMIITYRYLYGKKWADIVQMMYGKESGYFQKMKTFSKRIYREHEKALTEMARAWSGTDGK